MTEIGGPTAQAGIRYQDRVAALFLGRVIDSRERPRRDRPVEVRVESPDDVDDFVVRFDDGSRQYVQVKLALQRRGETWKSLWAALYSQLAKLPSPDDKLALILGEPSQLASDLRELCARTDGADTNEWVARLTAEQQVIAESIALAIGSDTTAVFYICGRLDVSVWPASELERDYVPLWMPEANVTSVRLFQALAGIAWAGAETRSRFDGAALRDRLSAESAIFIASPSSWGLESYRAAVVALAGIEVPGTGFRQTPSADYLWPRCLRFDRNRRPDFDDDLPGWRDFSTSEEVELREFPSADLNAVVVVAGPGFGKSTLVNAIARRTALAGLVPAIVSVTAFSDSDLTIAEYLEQVVNVEFEVRVNWQTAAATGALIILVDGLDEVSSDRRLLVLERLKVYRAAHPGIRWMLTVRDAAALALPDGATMVELAPLRDMDIAQYCAFYRTGELGLAEKILQRTASRTDLAYLTRIPIFLALMLVMRLEGVDLQRSDLLDTYIETLFRPVTFKRTQNETLDGIALRRIAERAAFRALETDSIGIKNQLFAVCVRDIAPTATADEMREALVRRGVLRRAGLTRLSFPFPIVQEYLASSELLDQSTDDLLQRLHMIFKRPWAQAVQFALERHPNPGRLVAQLLTADDDAFYTGLRLLGRCVANGMSTTRDQREEIGHRLAKIWGGSSWHTNKLINGIVVDAFARPLHGAIRARLGERRLIYEGSGTILALNRDTELTTSVLRELLHGDIDLLLNIGEMQDEVNRVGTKAFELYIERCRTGTGADEVSAISSLIGHMRAGSIDVDVAHAAADDETLPLPVRLAAWSKSGRGFNDAIERLVIGSMMDEDYSSNASAARVLASPAVDTKTLARLLGSPELLVTKAEKILDYVFSNWRREGRPDHTQALLGIAGLPPPLRDQVLLYSINDGNLESLDLLVQRMEELSPELVGATIILLGHFLDRRPVERIVAAVATRTWTAHDRVSIIGAFVIGLTHKLKMIGLRSGTLEPIPSHPGRNAPHALVKRWLICDDYSTIDRLKIVMDAMRLGIADARDNLRPALDAALAAGVGGELNDSALAGRAIELLHANGEAFSIEELEHLARNSSFNLATTVVALMSAWGSQTEVDVLMRLYEQASTELRLVILSHLEPLASRLSLRVMRNGNGLSAVLS